MLKVDNKVVDFVEIIVQDVMANNPGASFSPDDQMRLHKTIKDAMLMGYDEGVETTVHRFDSLSRKIKEEVKK